MVYICVLNYKNTDMTINCLKSLLSLKMVKFKILVIDNASSDESSSRLRTYADHYPNIIKFFPLKKNLGYAGGNNIGLKYALLQKDMDYCWILNNDTIVEEDSLRYLVEYMKEHPDVGLCGSKLIYDWDRTKIQGYGGKYNPWIGLSSTYRNVQDIEKIDFVIGASVFLSRSFLEDVGLMCEDYFLYYEELDWSMRAKGKFNLGCEPRSIVYHKEGASIGANATNPDNKSEFSDYYGLRNRLLFTRKFYPHCLITVYLSSIIILWNRLKRHQYGRIWMFIKLLIGIHDKRFEVS